MVEVGKIYNRNEIYLYEICTTRMPDVTMVPLVDNLVLIVPDRQIYSYSKEFVNNDYIR